MNEINLTNDMLNASHISMQKALEESAKFEAEVNIAPLKMLNELREIKAIIMALSEVLLTDDQIKQTRETAFELLQKANSR